MVKDKETSFDQQQQFRLPSFNNNNNNHMPSNKKVLKNDVKVLELNLPYLHHNRRHHYRRSRVNFGPPRWLNGGK